MIGIAQLVNEWVKKQLPANFPTIYNDVFTDADGDSIVCRHDPSQAAEKRFNDGSRAGTVNLSYHARSDDAKRCRMFLSEILNRLDTETIIDVSDDVYVECEALTLPQFVTVDDKNNTYYTASVRVEYTQEAKGM